MRGVLLMTDNDLIRRGDAMKCCTAELRNLSHLLSNPPQSSAAWEARNAINALPAAPTLAAQLLRCMDERDAGAKDYCALMDRHDAEFVRAETAEQRVATLEAEIARLRYALEDQADFLDQLHHARMADLGRDPYKYTTELSAQRDKIRAILAAIKGESQDGMV
jgi:acyl-CoA reductase-like NAD-dependent aldehyde dehydrogenase